MNARPVNLLRVSTLLFLMAFVPFSFYIKSQVYAFHDGGSSTVLPRGAKVEDFTLTDMGGQKARFSELTHGKRLVMLHFWASWCGPCREEMPQIVKAYNKFGGKGFTVISVNQDFDTSAAKQFIKDHQITFPVLMDLEGRLMETYNLSGLPSTLLLNGNGEILDVNVGERSNINGWVESWLNKSS